ncbi:MAG: T9SS type A sorting domain-containing protein [Bacteroidetes bacterium]|nr:T9SS type A sorting domain-containing protein [Bacteroidota bacterium]
MKKLALLFISLSFGLVVCAQAPSLKWAKSLEAGVSSTIDGRSVTVDDSLNVISTGLYNGTADFDPNSGVYNLSASTGSSYASFVSKLDSLGNFLWAVSFGDALGHFYNGQIVATDTLGNIYVTGTYNGTIDFDPGVGVYSMTSSGIYSGDAYILKLDPAGNFLWVKAVGTPLQWTQSSAISVDAWGDVYLAGTFKDTVDFDPGPATYNLMCDGYNNAFILKLDATGNFLWAKNIGGLAGSQASISGLDIDGMGNVISTGSFYATVDFDPSGSIFSLTSSGSVSSSDMFILKLDNGGNFVWVKQVVASIVNGGSKAVSTDSFGNAYITGWFGGTVDLDPGLGIVSHTSGGSSSNSNAFVLKLDPSGSYLWSNCLIHSLPTQGTSIVVDNSGNVYTTGVFNGTVDFNPGIGSFYLTSGDTSALGYHGYISKLDSSGNFIWAGALSGDGVSGGWGASLAVDALENIYMTGSYAGTIDVNPDAGIDSMSTIYASINALVLKMSKSSTVWPGDADHNNVANNYDLLPIGLFYGQTGTPRSVISNSWLEYNAVDWNTLQLNGADIKHADCNGDGIIDNNDTLAINLNYSLTHSFAPINNEIRLSAPDLYFVTSGTSYASGSIVDVEVWVGSSTTSVTNLYGLAFNINYDASLVQPASESLTFPASWFGTFGTDAITIAKIDGLSNIASGAKTRIDHTNVNGYGKVANFKFQLKSSIPTNTSMYFSISGYSANDSSGSPILFNTQPDTIFINSTIGVSEISNEAQISIYPNPTAGSFNIFTSEQIKDGSIEIYNVVGELILSQKIINQQNTIDLTDQATGLYFVKVISDGEIVGMKKVMKE